MKKLIGSFVVASALVASPAFAAGGITCAFGVPGFVTDDPQALAAIGEANVLFQADGTLGLSGAWTTDHDQVVQVAQNKVTAPDLFSFTLSSMGDNKDPEQPLNIVVHSTLFKGKFAGQQPGQFDKTNAATLTIGTDTTQIDGACQINKQ